MRACCKGDHPSPTPSRSVAQEGEPGAGPSQGSVPPLTPFSSAFSSLHRLASLPQRDLHCTLWRRRRLLAVRDACPSRHRSKGFARQSPPGAHPAPRHHQTSAFFTHPLQLSGAEKPNGRRLSHSQRKRRHFPHRTKTDRPRSRSTSKWSGPQPFCSSAGLRLSTRTWALNPPTELLGNVV